MLVYRPRRVQWLTAFSIRGPHSLFVAFLHREEPLVSTNYPVLPKNLSFSQKCPKKAQAKSKQASIYVVLSLRVKRNCSVYSRIIYTWLKPISRKRVRMLAGDFLNKTRNVTRVIRIFSLCLEMTRRELIYTRIYNSSTHGGRPPCFR